MNKLLLGLVVAPACLFGAAPTSDDFHNTTLNTALWTFIAPAGSGSFSMTGTNVLLAVPAGSNHDPEYVGVNNSIRLMQPITNTDFQVEVKFDSKPSAFYQSEGLIVEQDATNYMRFDIASLKNGVNLAATKLVNSKSTNLLTTRVTIPGASVWLRVQKAGSTWTLTWSSDGVTFNTGATFSQALTPTSIGPYAGNYGTPATSAPAFAASVDYFFNTASPIVPEDGGAVSPPVMSAVTVAPTDTSATFSWTTDIPSSSRVDYGTSTSYGSNVANATLVTSHSIIATGLTCSTTYNFKATSAASTGSSSSPNGTFTTNACVTTSGPVSDDFHNTALNTALWTFVNPVGNGSFSMTGTNLLLAVPAGSNHDPENGGANNSVRLMQRVANVDFQVEVRFVSKPSAFYETEGLIVEQDAKNYLRFDIASDSSRTYLVAAKLLNSTSTNLLSTPVTIPGTGVWLRVQKASSTWTLTWSPDGATFNTGVTFSQALTPTSIGPFAGNWGSPATAAPAFTASVDYFFNTASPIVPEDGGAGSPPVMSPVTVAPTDTSASFSWTTDIPSSSRVDYGTTTSYGSNVADATLVTSHSIIATGLTCSTTYNFKATSAASTGPSSSPNGTFTTNACVTTSGPASDSFDTKSLNSSLWTWVDPVGNSFLAFNGTTAQITVRAQSVHDAWASGGNNSARIVQPVSNTNFDVAAKFVSGVMWGTTGQGILVQQDASNYLRFEFRFDGTGTNIWVGARSGAGQAVLLNAPFHGYPPLWLRVTRSGNSWAVSWSADGVTYTPAGTVQQSLVASGLGLYATNYSAIASSAPAFTASVDAFVNLNAPVANNTAPPPFSRIVVDPAPGTVLVQETAGDVDGDGRPDLVVGFADPRQGIYWYRSPHSGVLTDAWNRFTIVATGICYEDLSVIDVNGDGARDVVASINSAIKWYENPAGHGGDPTRDAWVVHIIAANAQGENNLIWKDIDGDGVLDLVTPHSIYFRTGADSWQERFYANNFRGLTLLDIGSGRGAINLVGTAPTAPFGYVWYENPRETGGNARTGAWVSHYIGDSYQCTDPPSCYGGGSVANLASGELNGDGRMDVVTVQSEGYPVIPPGGLIWWEAPADRRNGQWIKHTIDPGFDSPHNVWVADMNKDGNQDIITAQQEQSVQRRVSVFFGDGKGNFSDQIVSNTGSHNPFLVDLNGDGWLDLFSAGHGRFGAPDPLELYINPRGGFRLP